MGRGLLPGAQVRSAWPIAAWHRGQWLRCRWFVRGGYCLVRARLRVGSVKEEGLTQPSSWVHQGSRRIYAAEQWMGEALSAENQMAQRKKPPLPPGEIKAGFLEEVTLELSFKG